MGNVCFLLSDLQRNSRTIGFDAAWQGHLQTSSLSLELQRHTCPAAHSLNGSFAVKTTDQLGTVVVMGLACHVVVVLLACNVVFPNCVIPG